MSETVANPMDAAIAVLRERERELDGEIRTHTRQVEIATARRDELLDLIATLRTGETEFRRSKPRPRKPRAVTEAAPSTTEDAAARPSVFAAPRDQAKHSFAGAAGEPAEAA